MVAGTSGTPAVNSNGSDALLVMKKSVSASALVTGLVATRSSTVGSRCFKRIPTKYVAAAPMIPPMDSPNATDTKSVVVVGTVASTTFSSVCLANPKTSPSSDTKALNSSGSVLDRPKAVIITAANKIPALGSTFFRCISSLAIGSGSVVEVSSVLALSLDQSYLRLPCPREKNSLLSCRRSPLISGDDTEI